MDRCWLAVAESAVAMRRLTAIDETTAGSAAVLSVTSPLESDATATEQKNS